MSEEHLLKQEYDDDDDDESPLRKKIKVVTAWNKHEKLEDRLNNILSCTVSSLKLCFCNVCLLLVVIFFVLKFCLNFLKLAVRSRLFCSIFPIRKSSIKHYCGVEVRLDFCI